MTERPCLTVYVRSGCHLCEDMVASLGELFSPAEFDLKQVDIDDSAELRARYNVDVPVLVGSGNELCHHFLDPLAVKEWLAGYNGGLI